MAGPGAYTKFSVELWDKFEEICERSKTELQFLREIHRYFKKRIVIEKEYSAALTTLSGRQQYTSPEGTLETAWQASLAHTRYESSLHGSIAASLAEKIVDPVGIMIKDMDQVRTRLMTEGSTAIKEYQKSVQALNDAQQKYNKLSVALVAARTAVVRNVKEKEREKLEQAVIKADQAAREADAEYRKQVTDTNSAQEFFFNQKLPKVHSEFEHSMFVRIHLIKVKLNQFLSTLEQVPPQDVQALSMLTKNIEALDNESDIVAFVDKHRTGDVPPLPFIYEEFEPDSDLKKKGKFRMSMAVGKRKGAKAPVVSGIGAPMPVAHAQSQQLPAINLNNSNVAATGAPNATVGGASVYQAFRPEPEPVGKVYGRSMAELMDDQQDLPTAIPVFLQRVVEAIYELDGPSLEGLFRIPPVMEDLNALKARIDREGARDIDIVSSSEDAHIPAGLLKAFLRELPEPLIPTDYYEVCIHEPERCIEVLNAIPELNRTVIVYLANFLQDLGSPEVVAKTLMTLENLSMIFAPSLLRCPYKDPMQILHAAKPEGVFALKLLQLMPTREQMAALEQPDYTGHTAEQQPQQQPYDAQQTVQRHAASSAYAALPAYSEPVEAPTVQDGGYAPLSQFVERG